MKLLNCLRCGDIIALRGKVRTCECGASKGRYVDNINAEYEGPSRLIGINNHDLNAARGGLPGEGADEFRCWVISDHCKPVKKLDKFRSSPMEPRALLAGVATVVSNREWLDFHPRGEMAQLAFEESLDVFDAGEEWEP